MVKKALQAVHRATLKQGNKPFKRTQHAKKPSGKLVVSKAKPVDPLLSQTKAARANLKGQKRSAKSGQVKADFESEQASNLPRLVAVVPFHRSCDLETFKMALLRSLLKGVVEAKRIDEAAAEATFTRQCEKGSTRAVLTVQLPNWAGKRRDRLQFSFCHIPENIEQMDPKSKFDHTMSVLDICKAADIVIGVFGRATLNDLAFDDYGYELKSLLCQQGLPWVVGAAVPWKGDMSRDSKSKAANLDIIKRCYLTEFGKDVAGPVFDLVDVTHQIVNNLDLDVKQQSEMNHFIRHLASVSLKPLSWRESERGYLLSENVIMENGKLIIEGCARGLGFTPKYPVHITGLGDFCCTEIWGHPGLQHEGKFVDAQPALLQKLERPDIFQNIWEELLPEEMARTVNTPVEEESSDDDKENVVEEEEDEDAWMEAPGAPFEENKDHVGNLEPRLPEDMEFDDEVDTPNDMPARERFAKYRGIKSLKNSHWDESRDNLPPFYTRIYDFDNFASTMKEVREMYHEALNEVRQASLSAGRPLVYVRLCLEVTESNFEAIQARCNPEALAICPLLVSTMLPIERKISTQHFQVQKLPSLTNALLPSKSHYIVQCGFRRFKSRPLFSKMMNRGPQGLPIDTGNPSNHKLVYRKFLPMQERRPYVASLVAPTIASKCPCIFFLESLHEKIAPEVQRRNERDNLETVMPYDPVIGGHFVTADPNRLIIRRIFLTGYPHRIKKKRGVVERMFFNRADVEAFMSIPVTTQKGNEGKIVEPLGLHGDMKCVFADTVSHGDTIRMALYKRVFPKL